MICLKSNQKGCIVITFLDISLCLDNTGRVSAQSNLKIPFSFASALDFHYIWIIQDAFGKVFQTSLKLYAHFCVYL